MPIFDAEMARAFGETIRISPRIRSSRPSRWRSKIGPVFVAIGIPVSMFFTGLFVWLAGKMFSAQQTIGDAVMVATYAWIPRVLQFVAAAAMGAMMDASKMTGLFSASLSAGKLLDPETTVRAIYIMAGRLDVFVLWQTILLGIGLSVTGKIARTQGVHCGGDRVARRHRRDDALPALTGAGTAGRARRRTPAPRVVISGAASRSSAAACCDVPS